MHFKPIYKDISIVTVGSINREICNPFFLFKHGFICKEEMESINDRNMQIGSDIVSFKTKSLELYCDQNRMQIRSDDSTRSEQLSDLTLNILRVSGAKPKAIGVNASFRFCLDMNSFSLFTNKCVPGAAYAPMAENALMVDLTFLDGKSSGGQQQVASYNIKRLPYDINKQIVILISVNNHLKIEDGMNSVIPYLAKTGDLHSEFFVKCQRFLEKI